MEFKKYLYIIIIIVVIIIIIANIWLYKRRSLRHV